MPLRAPVLNQVGSPAYAPKEKAAGYCVIRFENMNAVLDDPTSFDITVFGKLAA